MHSIAIPPTKKNHIDFQNFDILGFYMAITSFHLKYLDKEYSMNFPAEVHFSKWVDFPCLTSNFDGFPLTFKSFFGVK